MCIFIDDIDFSRPIAANISIEVKSNDVACWSFCRMSSRAFSFFTFDTMCGIFMLILNDVLVYWQF